jgi:DtxR family transcriptional regulator, Mn-dependent transcriptional regulator
VEYSVETLARLTRRQVDVLRAIGPRETIRAGVALKAIATALKVRPPSALAHVTPLEQMGLVERYRGKSRLTARGRATLVEYERHHRVAETLFADAGLSAEASCRAAREVDLALSHKTVESVCEGESHPRVCPHGEPIPPCDSTGRAG